LREAQRGISKPVREAIHDKQTGTLSLKAPVREFDWIVGVFSKLPRRDSNPRPGD